MITKSQWRIVFRKVCQLHNMRIPIEIDGMLVTRCSPYYNGGDFIWVNCYDVDVEVYDWPFSPPRMERRKLDKPKSMKFGHFSCKKNDRSLSYILRRIKIIDVNLGQLRHWFKRNDNWDNGIYR